MSRISVSLNTVSIDGQVLPGDATGVYVFGGYKKNDSNADSLFDSVNFDELEAYGVSKVVTDVELNVFHYELTKLSGEDVADYMPEISPGSSSEATGGTSPELLAIENEKLALEKERREEEKVAHKNLHSEEIVTTTDCLGNEETHIKGHYPSLRSHKYYEASQTQWGLNQAEILRHEMKAEEFEKTVARAGVDPFAQLKFNAEVEFDTIVSVVDNKLKNFTFQIDIPAEAVMRARGLLPLNDVEV